MALQADSARIEIKVETSFRDESGRFISGLKAGIEDALDAMGRDGMLMAKELAPRGHKPDPRTPSIQDSMYYEVDVEAKSVSWGSYAKHAYVQEMGGKRHPITGKVTFFWEKYGRMWRPGLNLIDHPGNPAHPYLRPSWEAIFSQINDYLRDHIKGRIV